MECPRATAFDQAFHAISARFWKTLDKQIRRESGNLNYKNLLQCLKHFLLPSTCPDLDREPGGKDLLSLARGFMSHIVDHAVT
ncbi:Hypothetical predicted protein [Pelobates cultripes]|uniref:Uncharacterized protein n=1 Tax=Pelobates cultripes TaxID=61616 RepID=A0AAD1RZ45_PELCU|nr:Hypothetical predicted protein [Pelobates cultripes]